jgi:hypothetical protein
MKSQESNVRSKGSTLRRAALIGGIALLLMSVLAAYANFGVMQNLIVAGDAQTTAENIMASSGSFQFAAIGFLVVAVLDVVVAWALLVILKPGNRTLSLVAAWLRIIYAAVYAFAISKLFSVVPLLGSADATQAMSRINAFQSWWDLGLILFGLHLLLVGYIAIRFKSMPWWLGILLAIAGLGYLVDSIGILVSPAYSLALGQYTFIGELVLIFWLLWKAIKGFPKLQEAAG